MINGGIGAEGGFGCGRVAAVLVFLAAACAGDEPEMPDGAAAPVCLPNERDCNGAAADSCETDVHFDELNCGACGAVCPVPTSGPGTPACYRGGCALDCPQSTWDCDNDPTNGCESSGCSAAVLTTLKPYGQPGAGASGTNTMGPNGSFAADSTAIYMAVDDENDSRASATALYRVPLDLSPPAVIYRFGPAVGRAIEGVAVDDEFMYWAMEEVPADPTADVSFGLWKISKEGGAPVQLYSGILHEFDLLDDYVYASTDAATDADHRDFVKLSKADGEVLASWPAPRFATLKAADHEAFYFNVGYVNAEECTSLSRLEVANGQITELGTCLGGGPLVSRVAVDADSAYLDFPVGLSFGNILLKISKRVPSNPFPQGSTDNVGNFTMVGRTVVSTLTTSNSVDLRVGAVSPDAAQWTLVEYGAGGESYNMGTLFVTSVGNQLYWLRPETGGVDRMTP